jgi:alpha-beta hydrolase superfamily lysophospholipase
VEITEASSLEAGSDAAEPYGRPILLTHGAPAPKVFVLLHGLTASPRQFVEVGRGLFERGANVLIPCLPRHGEEDRLTTVLQDLTAEELSAFARETVATARALGRQVVVVGFSLGGLLAAWLAQHESVDRVVAIAPFLGFAFLPGRRLTKRFSAAVLRLPNRFLWWNPWLRERMLPSHGYPRYATHAVAQAYKLAQDLFHHAARRAPATRDIALVLNASEMVVNNRSAARLASLWSRFLPQPIKVHRLDRLPPSHDIIESLGPQWVVPRVYPSLFEILEG